MLMGYLKTLNFEHNNFGLLKPDCTMPNKEPNVQVSDTTGDDSSNADDQQHL